MLDIRETKRVEYIARHPVKFAWRVIKAFMSNSGLLLSAAVAYNTLLSLIPALALILIALSHWFDVKTVEEVVRQFLELVAPTQTGAILNQLHSFYESAGVISLVGGATLVFFSTIAFSSLESALTVIFCKNDSSIGRKAWISILLPFGFLLMIGFAMLIMTLLVGFLQAPAAHAFGQWIPDSREVTGVLRFIGEVVFFAAIYFVLPPVPISLKHAMVGALTAAVLWELMRRLIVWYFENLSSVNAIYGTFATVLVVTLSLEVAATILLIGAQVIKEYEEINIDTPPR